MATKWPTMDERGPGVVDADVKAFEKKFGYPLPDDYREFLLDVNGGRPADTHCAFSSGVLNYLFSLKDPDEASDLETRALRGRKDLPNKALLMVGHDDGGGRILVVLDGEHRGEVWLQVGSDARPPGSNPRTLWHDRRDMKRLSTNWREFMSSLREIE
jgi:hypothetical protein